MTGVRRIEGAAARRAALEAEYRAMLKRELEVCARGVWGLFGQNAHLEGARSAAAKALIALGEEVDAARARAGEPPFALHARFMEMRGRQGENQPGEPKLARRLLDALSGR